MPVLGWPWRDVWPYDNPLGDNHIRGSECPCCPWAYRDEDRRIVVVHGWFTEQIIHIGSSCPADVYGEARQETEWVEVEVVE